MIITINQDPRCRSAVQNPIAISTVTPVRVRGLLYRNRSIGGRIGLDDAKVAGVPYGCTWESKPDYLIPFVRHPRTLRRRVLAVRHASRCKLIASSNVHCSRLRTVLFSRMGLSSVCVSPKLGSPGTTVNRRAAALHHFRVCPSADNHRSRREIRCKPATS